MRCFFTLFFVCVSPLSLFVPPHLSLHERIQPLHCFPRIMCFAIALSRVEETGENPLSYRTVASFKHQSLTRVSKAHSSNRTSRKSRNVPFRPSRSKASRCQKFPGFCSFNSVSDDVSQDYQRQDRQASQCNPAQTS